MKRHRPGKLYHTEPQGTSSNLKSLPTNVVTLQRQPERYAVVPPGNTSPLLARGNDDDTVHTAEHPADCQAEYPADCQAVHPAVLAADHPAEGLGWLLAGG